MAFQTCLQSSCTSASCPASSSSSSSSSSTSSTSGAGGAGGASSSSSSSTSSTSTSSTSSTSTSSSSSTSSSTGGPLTCDSVDGAVGCCDSQGVNWFCDIQMQVQRVPCAGGTACGWDAAHGWYDCVPPPGGADPTNTYPMACGF